MLSAFKIFLQSIKPTGSGVMALLLCVIFIPLSADVFLVFFSITHKDVMLVTPFIFINGLKYVPLLLLYLLLYFIIVYLFKKIVAKKQ